MAFLDAKQKLVYVSYMLDLRKCKEKDLNMSTIVNRGLSVFNIIYKSGIMERFSYCPH